MHGDKFLPLTSTPAQPERVERYQWVSFVISLVLHGLLLLLLPWLLFRPAPPPQPLEIEVQLESRPMDAQIQRQPLAKAKKQRSSSHVVEARLPRIRHKAPPVELKEMQVELKEVKKRKIKTAGHTIKLASSRMSAPTSLPKPGIGAEGAAGTNLQANAVASQPPRPAYAGSQASIAQAAPSRSGEDSSPGPITLAGSTPAVQSVSPEYRHASRPSGALASQGGAAQAAAGLAPRAYESRSGGMQSAMASSVSSSNVLSRNTRTAGMSTSGAVVASGVPSEVAASRNGGGTGLALAQSGAGQGKGASVAASAGKGASLREDGSGSEGWRGRSLAAPGELQSGGLIGASGPARNATVAGSGLNREGPEGSGSPGGEIGTAGTEDHSGLQQAAVGGGSDIRGNSASQRAQSDGGIAPLNASFETAENTRVAMQQVATASGSARLLGDRYTAATVKTASPTHFCEIPLMMAGLNAKPIPKNLDSIMPSNSVMEGEYPPRHLPGNMMPAYPLGAIAQGLHGKVVLRAQVLTNGEVGQVLIRESSGAQVLDMAAVDTVRHWHFQPAVRNGRPVVAWMTVPIEYRSPQNPYGANP